MKSQTPSRLSTDQLLTNYLKQKGYSRSTVQSYIKNISYFKEWLKSERADGSVIAIEEVSYQDGLAYLNYLKRKGLTQTSRYHYLMAVNHYYDYLIAAHQLDKNPLTRIKIRPGKRNQIYQVIEPHELHRIYASYGAETCLSGRQAIHEKRNKAMLGLLIYQGLRTGEVYQMQVGQIKLQEGTVQVHGSRTSNERSLELKPFQVMEMYEYIMQARPELLKSSGESTERLFVGSAGGQSPGHYLSEIMRQLRKNHPNLTAQQIRASVIVKWLKQYNLRKAQYLAGHRYVSSTEKYLQNEVEGLKQEIEQYHPLG